MRKWVLFGLVICVAAGLSGAAVSNGRTTDPLGVAVSPHMLVLGYDQGGTVTVHTNVPLSSVDTGSLALNGIPATGSKADNRGNLVAFFSEAEVKAIVAPPSAVLTLTGLTNDGDTFEGSDTASVVDKR